MHTTHNDEINLKPFPPYFANKRVQYDDPMYHENVRVARSKEDTYANNTFGAARSVQLLMKITAVFTTISSTQ